MIASLSGYCLPFTFRDLLERCLFLEHEGALVLSLLTRPLLCPLICPHTLLRPLPAAVDDLFDMQLTVTNRNNSLSSVSVCHFE